MPRALILSSHVAASRVGGSAQALALSGRGVDPILVPTTLFGRHPGLGAPGGGAVTPELFDGMLEGVAAQGALSEIALLITGYFASPEQVESAVDAIDQARAGRTGASPRLWVVVDPVMGDADRGLYVREAVAKAVARELAPRADVITPNLFELGRLTGREVHDAKSARDAARAWGRPCAVTSVPGADDGIGALWVDGSVARLGLHRREAREQRGAGDLFTAVFAAGLAQGADPEAALKDALETVALAIAEAAARGQAEIAALAPPDPRMRAAAGLRIETLDDGTGTGGPPR